MQTAMHALIDKSDIIYIFGDQLYRLQFQNNQEVMSFSENKNLYYVISRLQIASDVKQKFHALLKGWKTN